MAATMRLPFAPFFHRCHHEMDREMFVFGHEFDVLGLTQQQQQQSAPSSQNQSTLFRCTFGNI
jgi:hypothetical protein